MPELDDNYSAFSAENPAPHGFEAFWSGCTCYYQLGAIALQRQGLGNGVLAVRDPTGFDTGNLPPSNAPVLQSFRDLPPEYTAGVEAALGYRWDCGAIEVSGFYIPRSETNTVA
jgi:hypothetical protein